MQYTQKTKFCNQFASLIFTLKEVMMICRFFLGLLLTSLTIAYAHDWKRTTPPDSVLYTVRWLGIARGEAGNTLHGEFVHTHTNLGNASITGTPGIDTIAYCTVSGGFKNTASSGYATVAGGHANTVGGGYATVAGGYANTVYGDYSLAAGRKIKVASTAKHTFAFGRNFTTSTPNAVIFHNSVEPIKLGIGTTNPRGVLDVSTTSGNPKFFLSGSDQTAGNEVTLYLTPLSHSRSQKVALITEAIGAYGKGKLHFALDNTNENFNVDKSYAKLTIMDNGWVGIGTQVPRAKFEVAEHRTQKISNNDVFVANIHGYHSHGLLVHTGYNDGVDIARFSSIGHDFVEVPRMVIKDNGRVIVDGKLTTSILEITGGSDLSEEFEIKTGEEVMLSPGMVVSIDPENPGKLSLSNVAYDRRIAGIISGAGTTEPGMVMGKSHSTSEGKYPVALTGRVYCLADASNGIIHPGDLLTTADIPGHAMKVADFTRAQGAILGKAMSSLESGQGLVLVLVSLQ
jgi:hypothetical protein